ncbi:hypothetical protein BDZ45DRAFT_743779 [Acephala macrosclerotiorum]|nr:hypothetical protein BDZ45DRAFT_743779 [Acephala macrosclerotiorum]
MGRIWFGFGKADLAQPRLPGFTSMYLQFADNCHTGELLHDLKSLDSRLLTFLQKPRQANITEALSRTLEMLAMGFIRFPKANGIKLVVHSKAEHSTMLAISFTPTVMRMAFPTRDNTTNITSNRIVENPMYRLKPLMERRAWGQNKCFEEARDLHDQMRSVE